MSTVQPEYRMFHPDDIDCSRKVSELHEKGGEPTSWLIKNIRRNLEEGYVEITRYSDNQIIKIMDGTLVEHEKDNLVSVRQPDNTILVFSATPNS